MSAHNRYYEPICNSYIAALKRQRPLNVALWAITIDPAANVNKRVAALRLYVEGLARVPGLDADDVESVSDSLYDLSRAADRQGARALADVAHDCADTLADDARDRREWDSCLHNLNTYFGTPIRYRGM